MLASQLSLLSLVSAALQLPLRAVDRAPRLERRGHAQQDIRWNELEFYVDLEVGTPPQKISILLDTGSSDLWFPTPEACNVEPGQLLPLDMRPIPCQDTFDPWKSSSLLNTTNQFLASYYDGTSSTGYYVQDKISVGGATVENANFAYATTTTSGGVFGIGFKYLEGCLYYELDSQGEWDYTDQGCQPYDNFPIQLKNQGIISSTAYSIWMNDLASPAGNILFGGVDHAKYRGTLYSMPIDRAWGTFNTTTGSPQDYVKNPYRIILTLNQIKLFGPDGSSDILAEGAFPVVLDSGTTLNALPWQVVEVLANVFGGIPNENWGFYVLPCGVPEGAYIALNFRGVEVQVPLREFVRPIGDWFGSHLVDEGDGNQYCWEVAYDQGKKIAATLGSTILSSLYTVYDLEHGEVALAPAIYNQYDTEIEDVVDSIPRAVQAPAYSYHFTSSYLNVNPSPTIQYTLTAITSVYGETGLIRSVPILATGPLPDGGAIGNARLVDSPGMDNNGYNDTNTTAEIYQYINYGLDTDLPQGITTVISAGPPSTLSLAADTADNLSSGVSPLNLNSTALTLRSDSPIGATKTLTSYIAGPPASTSGSGTPVGAANTNSTAPTTYSPEPVTFTCRNRTSTCTGAVTLPTLNYTSSISEPGDLIGATSLNFTAPTTYWPKPTTFTWGNKTFTLTNFGTTSETTLPQEAGGHPVPVDNFGTSGSTGKEITTTCGPGLTSFSYGDSDYTTSDATTLTIISCPSTIVSSRSANMTTSRPFPAENTIVEPTGTPAEVTWSVANNAFMTSGCAFSVLLLALL